jgi:uncharacterized membrane protein
MVAYFQALAAGTMSVVAPLVATCAVIPVAVGLFWGEAPSLLQMAGVVVALLGVVLASREPELSKAPPGPLEAGGVSPPLAQSRAHSRSVALALFAALCFGGLLVGFAIAAEHDPLWPPVGARFTSVVVLGSLAGRRGLTALRAGGTLWLPGRALAAAAGAGLLHLAAATLFSFASVRGYLSLVAVLSSLSSVFIVAFAHLFLGESLVRAQRAGVLLALIGVLAIVGG